MNDVIAFLALLRQLSKEASQFRITIQGRPTIGGPEDGSLEVDFSLSAVLSDEQVLVIGPITIELW